MKNKEALMNNAYTSPKCSQITLEVGDAILTTSPVTWENNIVDPSWNTDGDYGLD